MHDGLAAIRSAYRIANMARYIVSFDVIRPNGKVESSSMEARSVDQCADIAFLVLTAQHKDAGTARADANGLARQLKEWRNTRATLIQSGKYSLIIRKL